MRKTSVYLTNDEADELRHLSIREGRSQAELIREGVHLVVAAAGGPARDFRSLGLGRGGGLKYERWTSTEVYEKAMGRR